MAEKKTLLILRLEGALQAWGEMSKWDFRDSADFPTKSGVVGLLGCAMGLERGDPQLAELSNNLRLAVRADRAGLRTVDFQTVTGDPLRTAEGKPKAGGNTIISRRAYLQDACFTVFLDIQDPWRVRIAEALKTPKWPMYLGRKNCVPSRPVWEAETTDYASLEEAVRVGAKTVAFPAISTGVYGYPKELAARVAVDTIRDFLAHHDEIREVRLMCYSGATKKALEDALGR